MKVITYMNDWRNENARNRKQGHSDYRSFLDIGEATAQVLSARRQDRLEQLAQKIGDSALIFKSDVTSLEDMKALVACEKKRNSVKLMCCLRMQESCPAAICLS